MANTYQGACFCGAVTVEVSGEPQAMGYCHCTSCRTWSGGPVNAFTLWPTDSVKVTKGADLIATYNKTEITYRKYCTRCGGHVMSAHPTFGMIDVFSSTIPTFAFKPALHVNYGETVLRMTDGLPKFKDFPEPFGGSGELVAE